MRWCRDYNRVRTEEKAATIRGKGEEIMRGTSLVAALLAGMALSACTSTNEIVLAPNVVRLDSEASGLVNIGSIGPATMKRAAESTLARGYTHFRLQDAVTSRGSRVVGMTGRTTGSLYGSTYTGTTFATPVRGPTASYGVTVVMFRPNEAGANGAWDASDVLARNGNV